MAEAGFSLINLGELTKPATKLIEKVSNAIGTLYEPTRIRKVAAAEADATRIKAIAQADAEDELTRRALERFIYQERRKQKNIEDITIEAARILPPDAKPEEIEEDWLAHFFKNCDTVSDKEMQSLWAKILAGEATNPKTFSKKTINAVASLDKRDAELFTSLCGFSWALANRQQLLVYDDRGEVYKKQGIDFEVLSHLDSIGLVSFEPMGYKVDYSFQEETKERLIPVFYYTKKMLIHIQPTKQYSLCTGQVRFTTIGTELFSICGAKENDNFYEYMVKKWFQEGIILSSIFPSIPYQQKELSKRRNINRVATSPRSRPRWGF